MEGLSLNGYTIWGKYCKFPHVHFQIALSRDIFSESWQLSSNCVPERDVPMSATNPHTQLLCHKFLLHYTAPVLWVYMDSVNDFSCHLNAGWDFTKNISFPLSCLELVNSWMIDQVLPSHVSKCAYLVLLHELILNLYVCETVALSCTVSSKFQRSRLHTWGTIEILKPNSLYSSPSVASPWIFLQNQKNYLDLGWFIALLRSNNISGSHFSVKPIKHKTCSLCHSK